ncbi:NAD+ synthase [Nonlabens dokdonensis]|uniref:NH(3)-dependent NAD(+) synthetase n=2 Tax=Nonlabens dokdonensis TaxID=328515 RepID=L7WAM8_NONDD|nr:NAD(+) synthase [Nonlabens dokdonensis]AGC75943.1 NH(3)-dependent NAD(+) synthetase [Nonlabens dokdonensis DSW-6]PZX43621.1 NAD+ synthase [Nonlabens dokdonensis]
MKVDKVADHIVKWLKEYAEKAGVKGYVVGVSGGIDSAVTSTLCAMTGLEVLCVEMPIHQHHDHVTRAQEHIKQLKERFDNVKDVRSDLSPVFDTFKENMPDIESNAQVELTLGNTRARLRMTTLYYHGGVNGLLVAGTGNKVEDFGVGFYTKYGDGGVDVSPIADLLKSEVYKIGSHLKVPSSIMKAAPSDGLYGAERTDEQQIGASYDELENAMSQVENKVSMNDLSTREKEVLKIYLSYNRRNQHKMNPIPVCEIPNSLR